MNIKDVILGQILRADKADQDALNKTFVNIGALVPSLNSVNNNVLFGRRGTGKTHVLKYLESIEREKDDCVIYIDMRTIGSSNSLYSDDSVPLHQRALSLLSDVVRVLHDEIFNFIVSSDDHKTKYMSKVYPLLENFVITADEKNISGDFSRETNTKHNTSEQFEAGINIAQPSINIGLKEGNMSESSVTEKESGAWSRHVNFNQLTGYLSHIVSEMNPCKLWVLIDEYSEINPDLQVYLSEFFLKVFAPIKNVVFKIATIEHRSYFRREVNGKRIGLEIGADVNAFNLDNFMVFNNNKAQSLIFFRQLLFNHIKYSLGEDCQFADSNEMINEIFTTDLAFEELVYASEGVARDAFNILAEAVRNDYYSKVSIPDIRKAAKNWYIQDKYKSVSDYDSAANLLQYIIMEVIKERHAKAFLIKNDDYPLINYLYDSRILHLLKRGVSSKDTPGVKYDVYSIDYGCYCDLINTANAPKGLLPDEDENGVEEYIEVPKDDYRSIRRAILDMDKFNDYLESIRS